MRIDIVTIFPGMFSPIVNESIVKRAQNKGKVRICIHNLRDYTPDKHKKVDDRPFGGGSGMVMGPEPIFNAVEDILGNRLWVIGDRFKRPNTQHLTPNTRIILLCPQGEKLNQNT